MICDDCSGRLTQVNSSNAVKQPDVMPHDSVASPQTDLNPGVCDGMSLRLICQGRFPRIFTIPKDGCILGRGNAEGADFFSHPMFGIKEDSCLQFFNVPQVGWYLRYLCDDGLFNGDFMDRSSTVILSNGDSVSLKNCHMLVEIE